jgi:riboflavin biosynthesis pyrimidine reductase
VNPRGAHHRDTCSGRDHASKTSARVLVESGPTSTARYLEEGAVDELFLTSAPILVGRGGATPTLGLVEGRFFPPGARPLRLVSARRGGSFLFLRYGC